LRVEQNQKFDGRDRPTGAKKWTLMDVMDGIDGIDTDEHGRTRTNTDGHGQERNAWGKASPYYRRMCAKEIKPPPRFAGLPLGRGRAWENDAER
jgi:hypothetical protein